MTTVPTSRATTTRYCPFQCPDTGEALLAMFSPDQLTLSIQGDDEVPLSRDGLAWIQKALGLPGHVEEDRCFVVALDLDYADATLRAAGVDRADRNWN